MALQQYLSRLMFLGKMIPKFLQTSKIRPKISIQKVNLPRKDPKKELEIQKVRYL